MKRIPLEQRLKAVTSEDSFFLSTFCLLPCDYFYALARMTGDDCFMERYRELSYVFPECDDKILAEIVYEAIEESKEHCIDLLYVMLVEPFTKPFYKEGTR